MTFVAWGRYRGRAVVVEWNGTDFVGDTAVELEARRLALEGRELAMAPTQTPIRAGTQPADVALRTLAEVIEIERLEGDVPEPEPVPDEAVA